MFKKLYEMLLFIETNVLENKRSNESYLRDIQQDVKNIQTRKLDTVAINNMVRTINSQQHTIEQLTNALKDKYKNGLFIVSNDCKIPLVIRNGEQIQLDKTAHFSIDWAVGEFPRFEMESFVGTFKDEEN